MVDPKGFLGQPIAVDFIRIQSVSAKDSEAGGLAGFPGSEADKLPLARSFTQKQNPDDNDLPIIHIGQRDPVDGPWVVVGWDRQAATA